MYINQEPILDRLEGKKGVFIAECRRAIEVEVSNRGRDCLAIREVGVRVHHAAPDSYMKVLWKFRCRELYHGHQLESVLTEPISNLVYTKYKEFLEEHREDIEEEVKRQIADSVDMSSVLEQYLFEKLRDEGIKRIRHEAVKSFVHGCHAAFHSQLGHTTTATVSHAVSSGVGTAVGASIAHALAIAIAHAIGASLVHVMTSVVLKAALKTVVVHSAGAIVTAVLVHLIATKMTAATASAALGPIAWVVGGSYVFYKVITIPETLGEKLGDAMADMLEGKFRPWTETALTKCFEKMADPKELLRGVVKAEIDANMPAILSEVEDRSITPPLGYEEVGKDVKKIVRYGEKGANRLIKVQVKKKKWWQ